MGYDDRNDKKNEDEKRRSMEEYQESYANKEHWISPKEVKKYAEYARNKERFTYNNGSIVAKKEAMPCIDRLHFHERYQGEPFLDSAQWDAGVAFKVLVDCVEGRITTYAQEPIEVNGTQLSPSMKMIAIYYQLKGKQEYYINRVLFHTIKEMDYPSLYDRIHNIRDAFKSLCDARKKDNLIAAHLEILKINLDNRKNAPKIRYNSNATSPSSVSPPKTIIIKRKTESTINAPAFLITT